MVAEAVAVLAAIVVDVVAVAVASIAVDVVAIAVVVVAAISVAVDAVAWLVFSFSVAFGVAGDCLLRPGLELSVSSLSGLLEVLVTKETCASCHPSDWLKCPDLSS